MARPAKGYSRVFCRGLELPVSYRVPGECIEWLNGYLAVDGDSYHDSRANMLDVLIVWRWLSWDVATIQRRRCVSRRYASDLFEYARAFDKHITGYMTMLADSLPLVEVAGPEMVINRHGLNLNRLAVVNKQWRDDMAGEDDVLCHIDRAKVRRILDRLIL